MSTRRLVRELAAEIDRLHRKVDIANAALARGVVTEIATLSVGPNDAVVATVTGTTTVEHVADLRDRIARTLGIEARRVLVKSRGVSLACVSQEPVLVAPN